MRRTMRPHSSGAVALVLLVAALSLIAGCGDGANDDLFTDARAQADAVVAAAPAAFQETVAAGNTATPASRDRLRARILITTDVLIARVSAPFDAARSAARAAGNEDDERFDNARRDRTDLILDAQDAALAGIDALDDAEPGN